MEHDTISFHINQTWLDKLGLNVPTTTDMNTRVLKAFCTPGSNGNGQADRRFLYHSFTGWKTYGENITIPLMNSFIYYQSVKSSQGFDP